MEEMDRSNAEKNKRMFTENVIDNESPIIFEEIVDKFEEISEAWTIYLNRKTGEFTSVPEEFGLMDEDTDESFHIVESNDWIRLPSQRELYEYGIMRNFALSFQEKKRSEKMVDILKRKKPYRRFKDYIKCEGIAQQYYAFRTACYVDKALGWCLDSNIRFRLRDAKSLPEDVIEKYSRDPYAWEENEELPF